MHTEIEAHTEYNGFWDCHEFSHVKESATRNTPNAGCDQVKIMTCTGCGARHVVEIWFFDGTREVSEDNFYGLEDPFQSIDDLLAPYL